MPSRVRCRLWLVLALCAVGAVTACAPEIGSEAWCERMEETPRGDWTANQAADYARHCLLE